MILVLRTRFDIASGLEGNLVAQYLQVGCRVAGQGVIVRGCVSGHFSVQRAGGGFNIVKS